MGTLITIIIITNNNNREPLKQEKKFKTICTMRNSSQCSNSSPESLSQQVTAR